MIKYAITAAILKAFSLNKWTKKIYRTLGNTIGMERRIRSGIPSNYLNFAKLILQLCRKYNCVKNDNKLLEIGTGWLHWGAIVLKLFYDVQITLLDVWDNRQLDALIHYIKILDKLIDDRIKMSTNESARIHRLLKTISKVKSFPELYDILDFQYVINPNGKLDNFPKEYFNLIFSYNVLEHISKDILNENIRSFNHLLKLGGYSIHTIDIGDHLSYYDLSVGKKNYLKYSDKMWKEWFENEVQYFNRVQYQEWLTLFRNSGFLLLEEKSNYCNVLPKLVDDKYRNLNIKELSCVNFTVVHKKIYDL